MKSEIFKARDRSRTETGLEGPNGSKSSLVRGHVVPYQLTLPRSQRMVADVMGVDHVLRRTATREPAGCSEPPSLPRKTCGANRLQIRWRKTSLAASRPTTAERESRSRGVAAEESQRFLCPSSGVEWSVTCCRLYVVFLPFKFCCAMAPSSGEKDCKGPSV